MTILKAIFGTSKKTPEETLEQDSILPESLPPAPEWTDLFQSAREEATEKAFKDHAIKKLQHDLFTWKYGEEAAKQGRMALHFCEEHLAHFMNVLQETGEVMYERDLDDDVRYRLPKEYETLEGVCKDLQKRFPKAIISVQFGGDGMRRRTVICIKISLPERQVLDVLAEYFYSLTKPE